MGSKKHTCAIGNIRGTAVRSKDTGLGTGEESICDGRDGDGRDGEGGDTEACERDGGDGDGGARWERAQGTKEASKGDGSDGDGGGGGIVSLWISYISSPFWLVVTVEVAETSSIGVGDATSPTSHSSG